MHLLILSINSLLDPIFQLWSLASRSDASNAAAGAAQLNEKKRLYPDGVAAWPPVWGLGKGFSFLMRAFVL